MTWLCIDTNPSSQELLPGPRRDALKCLGHPWGDATMAAPYTTPSRGPGCSPTLPTASPSQGHIAASTEPPARMLYLGSAAWSSRGGCCQATRLPPPGFHGDGDAAEAGWEPGRC